MNDTYKLYIGGRWKDGSTGERFPAINPYTRGQWATIPLATEADVEDAISAARTAFEEIWSKTAGVQRAAYLLKLADLLELNADSMGLVETTDNGKVIRETRAQMVFGARQLRFAAGYADKLFGSVLPLDKPDLFDYVTREPRGVCVLVVAWNSPISLLCNKLPWALASGNCVVIKPSEHASASTLEFCKLVEQAGFPPGVVNVVTGDVRTGRPLCGSRDIDTISFTGSPEVAREIAAVAGRNLVPVTLELGGKSPNIVFEDADFDKALVGAMAGIFAATGQTCIAGSRLLVQRPIYDRMVEGLVSRASQIRLGDPRDPATEMGTVANEPQFERILGRIERAKAEGARLVAGGRRAEGKHLGRGFFVEPTIFADVHNAMEIAQEEVFGPVLSIIPFDTEEDAIEIGNGTRYGLAGGVWTRDLSRTMRMTRALKAGVVWVNTYRAPAVQAPFGGVKESGFGRERGEQGFDEFTHTKNVMIDFSDEVHDPFVMRS